MRFISKVSVFIVAILVITLLPGVGGGEQRAEAATASNFDPGNIISDAKFYDGAAMTAPAIQSFLNSQVPNCVSSYACLTTFRQNTPTMAAVTGRCDAYQGLANEAASDIIARVGAACGISQKTLLVLLQKEQGLVTMSNPNQRSFDAATGMGCPDTAPCDAGFSGFFYQIYYAARQFKAYAASPNSWNHIAGRTNDIRFSPDANCGSSPVFIANQATAGLYNYTPYQPNAAAMANLYGTGDACSAYGNRNFWRIYTDWFGSTTEVPNPIGNIDAFTSVMNSAGATLTVSGWALDINSPATVIDAHVYVTYPDGSSKGTPLHADLSRPDVGAVYGGGDKHGYSLSVPVTAAGTYKACVYGIGLTNNSLIDCKSLTIQQNLPVGNLEEVIATGQGASTALRITGWSLDRDLPTTSIATHVYVTAPNGTSVGYPLTASLPRPDIANAFPGAGPNHGYQLTVPATAAGVYSVCAYAIGTAWTNRGQNPLLGCSSVSLVNDYPVGAYDSLTVDESVSPATLTASGWAFDRGAPATSIPVHLYVTDPSGRVVGYPYVADKPRTDVNRIFGLTGNHGFSQSIPITTAGVYQVCAFGIAVSPLSVGKNAGLTCKTINVVRSYPMGNLDAVNVAVQPDSSRAVTVSGWSFDQQIPLKPIPVHYYLTAPDGTVRGIPITADQPRPDVGAAFPGTGLNHGFSGTAVLTQRGTYSVCAYGIGWATFNVGLNSVLGCRQFVN